MTVRYVFRQDQILTLKNLGDADPQAIGDALDKIAADNGGELAPEKVVEAAKNRRSLLHRHFEWDDEKAAHSYRLDQARNLIRSIHREDVETESGPARGWLSVRQKSGVSYRSISDVLGSSDLQAKVLAAAERDLLAFESRYRDLTGICDLIRAVREQIVDRRSKLETGGRPLGA